MLERNVRHTSGDEDDEARFWVEWFARQADQDDPELVSDIELLSSILLVLEKNGRGRLVGEGMCKLGMVCWWGYRYLVQHLWSWWFDQGTTSGQTQFAGFSFH